jgi:ABC-2 type transport system ATP-binding protein
LTDELRRDLEEVLRKHGGALDTIGHPTTTLEDYFLHIVEESKRHPGRRYLPGAEAARVTAPAPAGGVSGAPGAPPGAITERP